MNEIARTSPKNKSSYILEAGHDEKSQIMQVMFHSGVVFNYSPVSKGEFEAVMNSASVGNVFIKHIQNSKTAEKVSGPKAINIFGNAIAAKTERTGLSTNRVRLAEKSIGETSREVVSEARKLRITFRGETVH